MRPVVKRMTVEAGPRLIVVNVKLPADMVAEAGRIVQRLQRFMRGRASAHDIPSMVTLSNVLRLALQLGLPEASRLSDHLLRDRVQQQGMVRGRRHGNADRR